MPKQPPPFTEKEAREHLCKLWMFTQEVRIEMFQRLADKKRPTFGDLERWGFLLLDAEPNSDAHPKKSTVIPFER